MSSINEKLGLPRAGKRSMMKLPKNLSKRNELTSARCPGCNRTGVLEYIGQEQTKRICPWCSRIWLVE